LNQIIPTTQQQKQQPPMKINSSILKLQRGKREKV